MKSKEIKCVFSTNYDVCLIKYTSGIYRGSSGWCAASFKSGQEGEPGSCSIWLPFDSVVTDFTSICGSYNEGIYKNIDNILDFSEGGCDSKEEYEIHRENFIEKIDHFSKSCFEECYFDILKKKIIAGSLFDSTSGEGSSLKKVEGISIDKLTKIGIEEKKFIKILGSESSGAGSVKPGDQDGGMYFHIGNLDTFQQDMAVSSKYTFSFIAAGSFDINQVLDRLHVSAILINRSSSNLGKNITENTGFFYVNHSPAQKSFFEKYNKNLFFTWSDKDNVNYIPVKYLSKDLKFKITDLILNGLEKIILLAL